MDLKSIVVVLLVQFVLRFIPSVSTYSFWSALINTPDIEYFNKLGGSACSKHINRLANKETTSGPSPSHLQPLPIYMPSFVTRAQSAQQMRKAQFLNIPITRQRTSATSHYTWTMCHPKTKTLFIYIVNISAQYTLSHTPKTCRVAQCQAFKQYKYKHSPHSKLFIITCTFINGHTMVT